MTGMRPFPSVPANAVVLESGRDSGEALSATMYHSAKCSDADQHPNWRKARRSRAEAARNASLV